MTTLLLFIKHHCAWLWGLTERLNGWLFGIRYGDLSHTAHQVLADHPVSDRFCFTLVEHTDLPIPADFLSGHPQEYVACFHPHPFDPATLERLFHNRAFLLMKVTDRTDNRLAGYFFLRCFFIGRAFHGLIVDRQMQGHGIGTTMWALSMKISQAAHLRMFATISCDNTASLVSCHKALKVCVCKELPNNYQLVECKPVKPS